MPDGGGTSTIMDELLHSGFISVTQPFGKKKKEALYRLADEFSHFYLQFMEKQQVLREPGHGSNSAKHRLISVGQVMHLKIFVSNICHR
jgi:hypothetical protein